MKRIKSFKLVERKTTAEEFTRLRKSVGCGIPSTEDLEKGLDNSLYGVCAIVDDEVVGFARVV